MPRSKRLPKEELFLSEAGCKLAARLYVDECDRRDSGQQEICEAEDLSPSTGTKFARLEHGLISMPDPSTIMRLGRQITDPATGNRFDPWKFLLGVCCAKSAVDLVKVALSIDPLVLEFFPRELKVDPRSIEQWARHNASAAPEVIEGLILRLNQLIPKSYMHSDMHSEEFSEDWLKVALEDEANAISQLVLAHMEQLGLKRFEFARRCKLKAEDIRLVTDTNDSLTDEIAEGLAYGFSAIMAGWTPQMVKAIDPCRFPKKPRSTQPLPVKEYTKLG